jgi:hypothetical protein
MKVFLLVLPKSTNNYPAGSFYEKETGNFKFIKHIGVVSLENIAVSEHSQGRGRSRPELNFTQRPLS